MAQRSRSRIHALQAQTGAVAAEFGVLQIAVAANRQIIVRALANGAALALAVENLAAGVTITSPSTPVSNGNFSDDNTGPTSAVTKGTTTAAPAADAYRMGPVNTWLHDGSSFVIGPGRFLVIRGVTVNTAAAIGIVFEEQDLLVGS